MSRAVRNSCVPSSEYVSNSPVITNLDSLLHDIHLRYIKLQEFPLHYKVFHEVFNDLHKKMKDVDAYFRKYSSTVQYAGSHFDNLRVRKPDEFDMDIVIGLPLNIELDTFKPMESDINIESKAPGFVQLKMGVQFQKLCMRDVEEWPNNKAAYDWMDDCNYLLRSKFIAWFESVVNKALNQYKDQNDSQAVFNVDNIPYIIGVSKSKYGPAITLLIRNYKTNFKMDIDLVPALKFPENRWPISRAYRSIPARCRKEFWMVVPKFNKESMQSDQMRSWAIALPNQERELLYNSYNLRQTIRLMKKLRDSLEFTKISSYQIKTLFFWEIMLVNSEEYWRSSPAILFERMVGKLQEALMAAKIPYYWDKRYNLLGGILGDTLTQYANRLAPLIKVLKDPSQYKLVAKYLLTPSEFADYNAKYLHIDI